jgi:deazaflavin-dependent oxidoreductase (nitroreductase family)
MADAPPDNDNGDLRAERAKPVVPRRELRRTRADLVGDAVFRGMTRLGVGPAHLLTTRGRRTGQSRTNPVILVSNDDRRWLVSPYGSVSWVLNARAAGRVTLRRGRTVQDHAIREVSAAEAGPILKAYVAVAPATRPYFYASQHSPVEEFVAEAALHPVFELLPSPA